MRPLKTFVAFLPPNWYFSGAFMFASLTTFTLFHQWTRIFGKPFHSQCLLQAAFGFRVLGDHERTAVSVYGVSANVLAIFIFITFFDLLIILTCAMLIKNPLENFKIVVMINCFSIINYTLWLVIKFALTKSSMSTVKDDISQAVKYIALLA